MIEVIGFEYNKDIIELAKSHAGEDYAEEIEYLLSNKDASFWVEEELPNVIRCFVCFINSKRLPYDVVYVTDKYNRYTLGTYRLMKRLHSNSRKTILSNITSNHTMMAKFAKVNNGYLIDDLLIFPYNKENK